MNNLIHKEVMIPQGRVTVSGELVIPQNAHAIIVFSHGSGSSRHSHRNKKVASMLNKKNFGTLLFDLLTEEEDSIYANRFDIELLAKRLTGTTTWLMDLEETKDFEIGYFGASTGAASALVAAASFPRVSAVVSRGGRPDLALDSLPFVKAATLLIVGGFDTEVIRLNRQAYAKLNCTKSLEIVPGATHLFEEPGKLDEVSKLAAEWFEKYLIHAEV